MLQLLEMMQSSSGPLSILGGRKLILGSASPRRKELLEGLGLPFTVDSENTFDEAFSPGEDHREVPIHMSRGKSLGFHRPLEDDEILLTADTMVLCGNEIMGKPHGRADAIRMLCVLSGRDHQVISAITLRDSSGKIQSASDTAHVWFKNLSRAEIEYYVDNYRPFDKAGAYGIQEWIGYVGIHRIDGSFFTIMGLPVHLVWEELEKFSK